MQQVINISRAFQLWRYEVSHSKLWLMSKMDGHKTRLSLVFKPVVDLCLPDLMFVESLEFEPTSGEYRKYLIRGYSAKYDSASGGLIPYSFDIDRERYVIALTHFLVEDELTHSAGIELFDDSIPSS